MCRHLASKPSHVDVSHTCPALLLVFPLHDTKVPDMSPDVLRQAMALGPVGKAELTHQASVYIEQN